MATPGELSYTVPSTGWTISGDGRALAVTGNNNNVAYRQLSSTVSSDDVWMSFLVRWQQGTSSDQNKFLVLWFDNNTSADHTAVPNIGLKSNLGQVVPNPPFSGDKEDIVVRLSYPGEPNSADFAGDVTVSASDAHLIVGHLYKTVDGAGNSYNYFEMWVDPTMQNPVGATSDNRFVYAFDPDGAGANKDHTTLTGFNYIGLRSANLGSNDVLLFDELRIGTTANDVLLSTAGGNAAAPLVPEPVTMAGILFGIGGLTGYVRRRTKK